MAETAEIHSITPRNHECNCEHLLTDMHAVLKILDRVGKLLDVVEPIIKAASPAAGVMAARRLRKGKT